MKRVLIKKWLPLLVTIGLVFLGMTSPAAGESQPTQVKVGVIIPLSGTLATIGTAAKRGATMAADRINREGGIKALGGAKLKLIFGDDEGQPPIGMAEAERLIKQEKVDALIGAYSSSVSFPVTQIAERYKVPIVVPASAKDEITERGFKYTFRLCDKASGYSKVGIEAIKAIAAKNNTSVTTLALLYEDSGWGRAYTNSLKKILPSYSYKVVADLPYSAKSKDLRPTILRLKSANPDVVVQVSYALDAILIIKTMHELDFNCKGIITGGSGHTVPSFYDSVGKLSGYILVTEPFSPELPVGEVKERAAEFKKLYSTPMDMYGAFFYTAVNVMADALNQAASVDKQKIRNALTKVKLDVGQKGNLFIYPATFDKNGQAPATSAICQWRNGKKEIVYPAVGATKEAVFPAPAWKDRK